MDIGDWITIKISGKQHKEYLDGIIPNNLDNTSIARSAILNQKGKIQVVFWISVKNDYYLLYVPPNIRDTLISLLLKYKLSMDIKLEDISKEIEHLYLQRDNNLIQGLGKFKFVHLDKVNTEDINPEKLNNIFLNELECPVELLLGENPYEVGLNDVIYLKKGCFLGQEPLSRMYNIGKPRSFLYLLELNDPTIKLDEKDIISGGVYYNDGNKTILQIKSNFKDFDRLKDKYNIKKITKIGYYPEFKRI